MEQLTLTPPREPFDAEITPPGSKSLTNRALVLAALAEGGVSTLSNVLFADDTLVMMECLARLGFRARGRPARPTPSTSTAAAGAIEPRRPTCSAATAARRSASSPPSARSARGHGTTSTASRACGSGRSASSSSCSATSACGSITCMEHGFPPVDVLGADGLPGGIVRFGGSKSSQFLSAVLQVAPYAQQRGAGRPRRAADELALRRDDDAADGHVRRHARADPRPRHRRAAAHPSSPTAHPYRATDYPVEPDASNATYFLAAAAISPGSKVAVKGLDKQSLQGDVGFADVLRQMGAGVTYGSDGDHRHRRRRAGRDRRRPVRDARHRADARRRRAVRRGPDDDPRPAHAAREGDRPHRRAGGGAGEARRGGGRRGRRADRPPARSGSSPPPSTPTTTTAWR